MDFLKTGIKTVLGSVEPGQQPSAAETVEKLVERVLYSTLLDDRRDACRALKALSTSYRIEVGAQGMQALVNVLENDRQDLDIVSYALDALKNVMSNEVENDNDEIEVKAEQSNVGVEFTEIFIKNPDNVGLILGYLEEYDFRVRRSAILLLTALITNKTRDLQELILINPMGVSKLMDLLTDGREVIRNDTLLLLYQLSKGNSNIQKIVAFENAFDRLFEIIADEGYTDGGIVVEDCLILLLNLLKNNSSNQQFFKEGSYIQKLAKIFEMAQMQATGEETVATATGTIWSAQKISNFYCMLHVVRALVAPTNQLHIIQTCQNSMRQSRLLNELCSILLSSGVPADILTETINTVAEIIRGNKENQDDFSKVMAPSTPPRSALLILLMSMINEKQLLALRCSVLYCFECYLYRNEEGQQHIVKTLLPSSTTEVATLTIGQILCTGIFSSDELANWFSAVALMHSLIENDTQKKELLRVLLASQGNQKPITLFEQCTMLIQQDSYKLQGKVGIFMLLSAWVTRCPMAVKALLQSPGTMSYMIAQITCNDHDEIHNLIQGLCAFLMGLCIQFNDSTIVNQTREDICQLVVKRIGLDTFREKLNEISRHESYTRASRQPQIRAKASDDLLLDFEFCKMLKSLDYMITQTLSSWNSNDGESLTELTLDTETSTLVNKYKAIIRDLDDKNKQLSATIQQLQTENDQYKIKLSDLETKNTQISDQNALLRAQIMAIQPGNAATIPDNSKEELIMLKKQLAEERERAERANDELLRLQKDQENLLELLSEQDNKLARYEDKLQAAGLPVTVDDEENNSNTGNAVV